MSHELIEIVECSYSNSNHCYSDGYNRALCSCGWKSLEEKDKRILVELWKFHVKRTKDS